MFSTTNVFVTLLAVSATTQFWLSQNENGQFSLMFEEIPRKHKSEPINAENIAKIEFDSRTFRNYKIEDLTMSHRSAIYFKVGETTDVHATPLDSVESPVYNILQLESTSFGEIDDEMYFDPYKSAAVCVMSKNTKSVVKGSPYVATCIHDFKEMKFDQGHIIAVYEDLFPETQNEKNTLLKFVLVFDEELENLDEKSISSFVDSFDHENLIFDPQVCVYQTMDATIQNLIINFRYGEKQFLRQTDLIKAEKIALQGPGNNMIKTEKTYATKKCNSVQDYIGKSQYKLIDVPTFAECAKQMEKQITQYDDETVEEYDIIDYKKDAKKQSATDIKGDSEIGLERLLI